MKRNSGRIRFILERRIVYLSLGPFASLSLSRKVLVLGALGMVGRAAMQRFAGRGDVQAVGLAIVIAAMLLTVIVIFYVQQFCCESYRTIP